MKQRVLNLPRHYSFILYILMKLMDKFLAEITLLHLAWKTFVSLQKTNRIKELNLLEL